MGFSSVSVQQTIGPGRQTCDRFELTGKVELVRIIQSLGNGADFLVRFQQKPASFGDPALTVKSAGREAQPLSKAPPKRSFADAQTSGNLRPRKVMIPAQGGKNRLRLFDPKPVGF